MKKVLILFAAIVALVSCDYKDLCYNHDEHSLGYDVNVKASYEQAWEYRYEDGTDWLSNWPSDYGFSYGALVPALPSGLRGIVYFPDGHSVISNMPASGEKMHLAQGPHNLIFHNNDSEYIVFDQMESFASARATTRTKTRASYQGSPYTDTKAEKTVGPPDMLYGHYFDGYEMEKSMDPVDLPVMMRPLVFTYYVRIKVTHGLNYIALARGALAGMASSVSLHDGRTSPEPATVLFDCNMTDFGADAAVRSFGVPNFPNPDYTKAGATYGLNVEFRLKNGKIVSFDRDVTGQMASQPHGGVIEISDIEISDEEGKPGSSGFLVDVDDWGEFNDIYLPTF